MQKFVMKVGPKNLRLLLSGKFLGILIIGSFFSRQLLRYDYYIQIVAALLLIGFINDAFVTFRQKKRMNYLSIVLGYLGAAFVILSLGIQSPQIPYKLALFIFALVLTLPAMKDLVKN